MAPRLDVERFRLSGGTLPLESGESRRDAGAPSAQNELKEPANLAVVPLRSSERSVQPTTELFGRASSHAFQWRLVVPSRAEG